LSATDLEETRAAVSPKAGSPSRATGGAWMTLVALLGAGWGALLSYSAFYLTADHPAPASARTEVALPPVEVIPPQAAPAQVAERPVAPAQREPKPAIPLALAMPDPAPVPQPGASAPLASFAPNPIIPSDRPAEVAASAIAEAAPEFVGIWGPNARACGARSLRSGYLPARLTAEGAKAGDTTCEFRDRRRSGDTWIVTAACRDGGKRWSSQVRLLVENGRLTWTSPKGMSTYVRCRRAG
jgi:hypothetical protein